MGRLSGPARKKTDRQLFRERHAGLGALQQQSRKELRQNAREEYWALKMKAAQAEQDSNA